MLTKLYELDGAGSGSGSQPTLEQLKAEVEKYKSLKDEAFGKRDEYKTKLKAMEDQIAEAQRIAQEKNGEFQKLYETESEKAKRLEEENRNLSSYKEKYSALEQQRRDELISQLPDDGTKAIAAKMGDVALISEYVQSTLKLIEKKIHTDGGRSGNFTLDMTQIKSIKDLTWAQREELQKSNPQAYKELFNKTYKQ